MLDKIKFPYFNMQQLNLDWILTRMSHYPEIVDAPPLAADNNPSVYDVIDSMSNNIPTGLSFLYCGEDDALPERCCVIMLYKTDYDNCYGIILSTSENLRGKKCAKINGNWVMYA